MIALVQGWTNELGPFTLTLDGAPAPLDGVTVEVVLFRYSDPHASVVTGAGTVRVPVPANGQVYYAPAAGDFKPGSYHLRFKVTNNQDAVVFFPSGSVPLMVEVSTV